MIFQKVKWLKYGLLFGCREEAPVGEIIRPVKALKVADADTFEGITYNGIAKAESACLNPFVTVILKRSNWSVASFPSYR